MQVFDRIVFTLESGPWTSKFELLFWTLSGFLILASALLSTAHMLFWPLVCGSGLILASPIENVTCFAAVEMTTAKSCSNPNVFS